MIIMRDFISDSWNNGKLLRGMRVVKAEYSHEVGLVLSPVVVEGCFIVPN